MSDIWIHIGGNLWGYYAGCFHVFLPTKILANSSTSLAFKSMFAVYFFVSVALESMYPARINRCLSFLEAALRSFRTFSALESTLGLYLEHL